MPTTQIPSKDELVTLSEQLKRLLVSTGRGRKGNLSAEFRQELLGALDYLSELAVEAAFYESELAQEEHLTRPVEVTAPLSSSPEADLSSLVTAAVEKSLIQWQGHFAECIVRAITPSSDNAEPSENLSALEDLEAELVDTRLQLGAANEQLADCQLELKFFREKLEKAEYHIAEVEMAPLHISGNDDDLSDQLKLQLEDALNELADLREQNSDLAAKLAHSVTNAVTSNNSAGRGSGEQLSWEQRKLLILKQLEGDTSTNSASIPHHDKLEVQEIIDASQLEIARRDEEIDELREIVRMQSEARNGVAIGAAGVAQMLDSDELVQQERQKLRDIQQEWESKLRQAEIDLSMERAKIARERNALEKQKEEMSQIQVTSLPKEKTIERRWLRILGLGEQADSLK